MAKTYTFVCYDNEDKCTTEVTFKTDNDCWDGFDGPMSKFFDFLKGCGFVFDINSEIGVMDDDGDFRSSVNQHF
jgi:hypothetical protein